MTVVWVWSLRDFSSEKFSAHRTSAYRRTRFECAFIKRYEAINKCTVCSPYMLSRVEWADFFLYISSAYTRGVHICTCCKKFNTFYWVAPKTNYEEFIWMFIYRQWAIISSEKFGLVMDLKEFLLFVEYQEFSITLHICTVNVNYNGRVFKIIELRI